MKILIIEPYTEGHRAVYAARLVRGALDRGHQVVFAALESARFHSEYQSLLQDDVANLKAVFFDEEVPAWAGRATVLSEWAHWLLLRKMARKIASGGHEIDVVLVCYLDYCMHMMAVLGSPFGPTPFSGIVMKAKFHHRRAGVNTPAFGFNGVKEYLFGRLLKNRRLQAVFTIDETLALAYCPLPATGCSKVIYLHDPSEMEIGQRPSVSAALRPVLQKPGNGPVILVYGWLNRRKGIQYLLPVIVDLRKRGVNVRVLLAGCQDDYVSGLLCEAPVAALVDSGAVLSVNRFVTASEELEVFDHADIVWLGYESFYVMSGVMVQAGRMGKPVLVTGEGLVSWMTEKYQTGLIMEMDDSNAIAGCIERLVTDQSLRDRLGENATVVYADHSLKNFLAGVFEPIEEAGQARLGGHLRSTAST